LRIQACGVRNRRIIRKVQDVKPFRPAVQNRGAKALRAVFISIFINQACAPLKFAALIKQAAVMAQVLYTNLEFSIANAGQKIGGDRV
jgi:hypothetical protein